MKRALAVAPLIVLALLVGLSTFLLTHPAPQQERELFTDSLVGREAPAFSLERLGGGPAVTGEAFAGRPYVLNIFASWCVPCLAEHSLLTSLAASGVEIVGVAYKDEPENAAAFLRRNGSPYVAVGLDPHGRFSLELGRTGVPETIVVGADGRVIAVHRGPLTQDIVDETILPALHAAPN